MWPEVTGMGEQDETADDAADDDDGAAAANVNGDGGDESGPIEVQDDDEAGRDEDAPTADSPFGGTGLGAIAAANRNASRV
jgi:hypothetical protein